jgi:hypothetical protein
MTTLKIESTDSKHNRLTCKIYRYSKLPVTWYCSIQTSHSTSKISKFSTFIKIVRQNCDAHMFTQLSQLPSAEVSWIYNSITIFVSKTFHLSFHYVA